MRSLMKDEELVPRRKRVVFAFSWTWGSRLASSRFERAFFGLLVVSQQDVSHGLWRGFYAHLLQW